MFILGILGAGGVYGLNTWQYVHISQIDITGVQTVKKERIQNRISQQLDTSRWKFFKARSIAFLPAHTIEQKVNSEFSRIKHVNITRRLPNKIRVEITEHTPMLVYCANQCYEVSRSGLVIDRVKKSQSMLPQLTGYSSSFSDNNGLGDNLVTGREAQWIYTIIQQLQNRLELQVTRIDVQERFQDNIQRIRVYVDKGYYLKIDSETDVLHQIGVLEAVLVNTISDSKERDLEYIDIRIKNRAYYK